MEPRTCVICGKPVQRNKAYKWPKTCSRACANRSKNGGQEARFWAKVDRSGGPDACWPFMAYRHAQGYGRMNWNDKLTLAHRIAWEIEHGEPLPDDEKCLHSCDNPPCCNPAHLHRGTQLLNNQEAYERDRQPSRLGKANPNARLTEDDVREIRRLYATGGYSQWEVAIQFGINQAQVSEIVRRVSWTDVE